MKKLKIITIIISIICMLIYEIGFCNLFNILQGEYNFSLFRIIVYFAILFLYIKFSKGFIEEIVNTIKNKKKLIIGYVSVIVLYSTYVVIIKEELWDVLRIIMAELLGLLFIIYITKDYIKNIVVTTMTLGIMFSLTNDVFHIMDEKQHFNSALNLAYGNFNYLQEPLSDKVFMQIPKETPMKDFVKKYGSMKNTIKMEEVEFDASSTPMEYSPVLYVPSALGINLARFLGGSMLDIFITGRVVNLFAFSGMLILIFKFLPFKKNTFYCIYLLPQIIALAASFSMDALTVGTVGIFIAYTLKIYKENKDSINVKQFLILIAFFILSLLSKHGVYLGICIVSLILPIIKSIKKDKRIILIMIVLLLIAGIWGILKFINITQRTGGDPKTENTNPKEQLQFILSDPNRLVYLYKEAFNTTIFNLNYYQGLNLKSFMGKNFRIMTCVLLVFCIYTATSDGSHNFKKKEKGIMITSFIVNFFVGTMTLYLLYTDLYSLNIQGYQARYLIPILPLVLICVHSNAASDVDVDKSYNSTSKNMGIFIIIDLLSKIIS